MSDNQKFQIGRLFVTHSQFKSDAPTVFKKWEAQAKDDSLKPDNRLEFKIHVNDLKENNLYEVSLELKMIAKHGELELYIAEVMQAGIFMLEGYNDEERDAILNSYCLSVIYPYASQCMTAMIGQGGFVAQPLPPINFDALYKKSREQQKTSSEGSIQVDGEVVH